MDNDWWLKYVPAALESMEVYIERVSRLEEMEFVMMKVSYDDLEVVARSYDITKVRHAYEARLYAVMIIRDLIFLTYTEKWSNGAY
jgi:hypothetical protein